MEFDIADPPLTIMEFSIIFFIFLNEGFPDEGRGHAEVEGEEEREHSHDRVHLQHQTAVILPQTRLLYAWEQGVR